MRWGIVTVLAFLAIFQTPVPGPRETKGGSSGSVKNEPNANQKPTGATPPLPSHSHADENRNPRADVTPDNEGHSVRITSIPQVGIQSKKDGYDISLVIFTGLLVAVGAFQIVFLWRTVTAASVAADAAKKSADALINSERAWLLVELMPWNELEGTIWIQGNEEGQFQTNVSLWMVYENAGRSPCWIVEKWARLQFVGMKIPENPPEPFFKDGDFRDFGTETIPVGKIPTRTEVMVENAGPKPTQGSVIIYGCVRYRDIFEKPRETWFGYDVSLRGDITRIDLRAYNHHT